MHSGAKGSGAHISRIVNPSGDQSAITMYEDFLRVYFGDPLATYADYHYFWLRLHHPPEDFRHPDNIISYNEIPVPNIRPLTVALTEDCTALELVWGEAHGLKQSTITLEWLLNNAYAINRQQPEPVLELTPGIDCAYSDNNNELVAKLIAQAQTTGFAQGLDFNGDTKDLIQILQQQNLQPLYQGQKLTASSAAISSHYCGHTQAPALILIHCAHNKNSVCNYNFVNLRDKAEQLYHKDFFAFSSLAEQVVFFSDYNHKTTHSRHAAIIEYADNKVIRVNYALNALQPARIAFSHLPHWYHSLRILQRYLLVDYQPSQLDLRQGDFVLINPAWYGYGVVQQASGVKVYEVALTYCA